ncbi:TIGR02452 family protein [Nocardia otitidiscaviarum]|uniref:TIGR02452 family protein n=1 Tax=Nocardia otitidiscaviarum TaxID=1823 RepID=A0A516NMM9_9NOCA|nr:TIGR02452 family protein [Nocardia otitidiscaviarum]MCP9624609.1 TIGR02452 family protein [Nocardia otitidiscaviarum]QDP80157.1 TIGR02452 family protein [Nocardia otitidiscaviarum]
MSTNPRHTAAENERIADLGGYRTPDGVAVEIGALLAAARRGTVSYAPEDDVSGVVRGPFTGTVEVTAEGSMTAARRLRDSGRTAVGVLNFASARNPGGGYLRGARAQEEDLCRSALLYRCLLEAPDYYAAHRASNDLRYSHRVIFSPDVPVVRDDRGDLLATPYPVSFLTSPAPNAGELARRSGAAVPVRAILMERATRVLAVAARHEVRDLVLGAWGCGVFRNDPAEVAAAFEGALTCHGAAFERVVFAVWDRTPDSANRAAFTARFAAADAEPSSNVSPGQGGR